MTTRMKKLISLFLVILLVVGSVNLAAYAKDNSDKGQTVTEERANAKAKKVAPKKVKIEGSKYVAKGKKIKLTATVSPEGASQKVIWTSSNPSVAKVDKKGNVKGVKPGKVKITAASADNPKKKKAFTIQVMEKAVKKVIISGATESMLIGTTLSLQASPEPKKAAKSFTWSSSDANIATVSNTGVVTAVSEGLVTITAAATDGSKKKGSVSIQVVKEADPVTPPPADGGEGDNGGNGGNDTTATSGTIGESISWSFANGALSLSGTGEIPSITDGEQPWKELEVTSVVIGNGITSVGENAFKGTKASSVTLPDSLKHISANAFGACSNLTEIHIPSSVDEIANKAFAGSNLQKITGASGSAAEVFADSHGIDFVSDGSEQDEPEETIKATGVRLDTTEMTLTVGDTRQLSANVLPRNATNKKLTWESSNTKVATVDNGEVVAVKAGSAIISVTSEDGGFTQECNVMVNLKAPKLTSAYYDANQDKIIANWESVEGARVYWLSVYEDPDFKKTGEWEESSTESDEVLTSTYDNPKKNTIFYVAVQASLSRARCMSDYSNVIAVKVGELQDIKVTDITIDTSETTLSVGGKTTFEKHVLPENATDKSVTWSVEESGDGGAGTIKQDGTFTATKAGTVTVKATANDGSKVFGTATVTIIDKPIPDPDDPVLVTSIQITPSQKTIQVDDTLTLKATVLPTNADNRSVTWSMSGSGTGTINEEGTLHATQAGEVIVTASAEDGSGIIGTATIIIEPIDDFIPVSAIQISPAATSLYIDKEQKFKASITPENATVKSVTWSVKNGSGIGTIEQNGNYTAKTAGKVTVIATADDGTGVVGTAEVTNIEVIKAEAPVVKNSVTGTTYTAKEITEYNRDKGGFNLTYSSKNGSGKYHVTAIIINETPLFDGSKYAENQKNSEQTVKILYDDDTNETSLPFSLADLQLGSYLKVAIGAYSNDNATTTADKWTVFGIKLVNNQPVPIPDDTETYFAGAIWTKLKGWGFNDEQAAGIMGNIAAESAYCPYNAQDSYGYDGVDNRKDYIFRTNDAVGFGLCQWTASSRKARLSDQAQKANKSVWNFEMQMAYLKWELENMVINGQSLENYIKGLKTIKEVTEFFMTDFEGPADTSASAKAGRVKLAQKAYDTYAKSPDVKVTSITIGASALTIGVGGTNQNYLPEVTCSPSNASQSVSWKSNKTSIAKVDATTGVVTGVAAGSAIITATATDGSGITATYTVYIVGTPTIKIGGTAVTANTTTTWSIKDAMSISWSGESADRYQYKIITLNEEPDTNQEQGNNATVETIVNQTTANSTTTYSLTAAKLATYAQKAKYLKIWVKALNSKDTEHGPSAWIGVELQQDPNPNVLSAPSSVSAVITTQDSDKSKVTWSAVTNAASYRVYYSKSEKWTTSTSYETANKSAKSKEFSDIGKGYYFWVAAVDSNGNLGSLSSSAYIPSKAVAAVSVTGHTSQSITPHDASTKLTISWSKPSNTNGTYQYKVLGMTKAPDFDSSSDKGTVIASSDETTKTSFSVTSSEMSKYSYLKIAIAAEDTNYNVNKACSWLVFGISLTGSDPELLEAPKNFKTVDATKSAINVSWSKVTGASGYYVYYSTSNTFNSSLSKTTVNSGSKTAVAVEGLSSGTTYYIWIAAYDSDGNIGEHSSSQSMSTGSVSLTVKINGSTVSNKDIIDWSIGTPLSVVCSNTKGNGKYLVKSFVTSSKPSFGSTDIDKLVTGVGYNGTGFYYGSKDGNDEFAQSTMNSLPFDFSDCSEGQYVKIWIAAEDTKYSTNDYKDGIQFAMKLKSSSGYYSSDAVSKRMDDLYNKLDGGYFTVNQASCTSSFEYNHSCDNCFNESVIDTTWFKNIFGTVSYKSFPASSGYTQNGWSCLGFAHFAAYWIYRDPSNPSTKVTSKKIGTYTFNQSNATKYAHTGDLIRFDSSHSAICYYSDSNGMYVLDCNYGTDGTQCRVARHYIGYSKYTNFTINRCDNAE